MRVIIVTPYDSANFGAFLQAYCLKKHLEDNGHIVKHIPTRSSDYVRELYYHAVPKSRHEKLIPGFFKKQKKFGIEKLERFKEAQKCFNITNDKNDADAYIVGSDEIWNVNKDAFQKSVFWGNINVPTISYAASIGNAKPEDFEQFPYQTEQLRHLKAALVRDDNTMNFVSRYSALKPEKVCDPTILVDVNSYGNEINDDFIKNNKCLLVYAYRLPRKLRNTIAAYAKKKGLKTVACCFQHDWCDYQCSCGPLEFSSLIRQCEEVVTTTFHGTIFAMLNHAEFISIPKSIKTNQLLEQFGLGGRAISREKLTVESMNEVQSKKINYAETEELIKSWREKSAASLKLALEVSQNKSKEYDPAICFSNSCTGCFACKQICPKDAISISIDEQGRTMPEINMELCVKCGACKKICPQRNHSLMNEPNICYAAQRIDKQAMEGSSSGGIGAVLSEYFVDGGNSVCGSVIENGRAVHRIAESREAIEAVKGSKYVQSDVSQCYNDIKECLAQHKKVLFVGTPCQADAMKKFFGSNPDFYCVDLVCHGVPPMKLLSDHINAVAQNEKIDKVSFRGAPVDYVLKLFSNGKLVYEQEKNKDLYFYSFMKCTIFRENCYNCPYAQSSRCGDLTIGDFWRINRKTLKNPFDGKISLVFVNSDKGRELFEAVKDKLMYEEREISEAVKGNPQLYRPSVKHRLRRKFLKKYISEKNFDKAITAAGIEKEMKNIRVKQRVYKAVKPILKAVKRGK